MPTYTRALSSWSDGEDLNKLRCPVQPQRPEDLHKLISATEASIRACTEELTATNSVNAGKTIMAPSVNTKYTKRRAVQLRHDTRKLEQLRRLEALGAAPPTTSLFEGGGCAIS